MMDATVGPDGGCDPNATPTDCGSKPISLAYFLSFVVMGSLVLLNLVVAVVLEHFSALGNVRPDLVSASDINDFAQLWAQLWAVSAFRI